MENFLTGSIVAAQTESVWHKRIRSRAAKGAASCPRPSGTTEGVTQSASFTMGLPGGRGPAEDKAVKVNYSGNRSDSVHAACSRGVSHMCSSFLIHVLVSDLFLLREISSSTTWTPWSHQNVTWQQDLEAISE